MNFSMLTKKRRVKPYERKCVIKKCEKYNEVKNIIVICNKQEEINERERCEQIER